MIIVFRPRANEQDEYVVCPLAPASIEELRVRMLSRAKVVEGSYAFRLIEDLHSDLFRRTLDLKADYIRYFAQEYGTFEEFLRRRTPFPTAIIDTLAGEFEMVSGIYHFRPWQSFLSDEYGLDFLNRLLEGSPFQGGT